MEVDSDSGSRWLALIRAVRTLDEDATIALPDKIQRLWLLLSATKSTRFHGVEENILRWLFKHMSGKTEDAEQVRRYPLTWSILGHIFPKIPSQSLGRSLGSLRFVSVLRQTVRDITTAQRSPSAAPGQTNGTAPEKSKKRKRDTEFPSGVEELRTPRGCIKSAIELFSALGSLLGQADHRVEPSAPERKVGAEHIKSLFSSSNEETRDIAAELLLTCDRSLNFRDIEGITRRQEPWVGIVTTLWSLRLHNKDDSLEFARHMYVPVCSILWRLRGNTTKTRWTRQLEQFLSAYLIRPARHVFSTDGNIDVLETALQTASTVSGNRDLSGFAIVTWDVAARTPRDSSNPKSKLEHLSWARKVFERLLNVIQPSEPIARNALIIELLDTAIKTNSVPDTVALRAICGADALQSREIDWALIAKVVACDADVFLMDDALTRVLFRTITSYSGHDRDTIINGVILPLQEAYAKARNFPGFIQNWYDCLCDGISDSPDRSIELDRSIWVDPRIRERLASILQSSLTSTQLLRVLERLDLSGPLSGPLLIVLDGISAGITEEDFIKNAYPKIFSAICKDEISKNIPTSILSLRWRIAGQVASWETSDEVYKLCSELKPTLKRILKRGSLSDPETFEAFRCCRDLWMANYPEGKYEADLAKLAYSFLERHKSELETESDRSTSQPYVDYVFRSLPKLIELPKQEANSLKDLIVDLFWQTGQRLIAGGVTQFGNAIPALLHNPDCEDNEALVDSLISKPLNALDNTKAQSGWTHPQSLSLILFLLEFPKESLTKGRRKRIMASWKRERSAIATNASLNPRFAVAVLRLLVKVMQQPTFYEGMEFDDLVFISSKMWRDDEITIALIEKLIDLTLSQMVISADGPSLAYLTEASKFTKSLKPEGLKYTAGQILLVKGLVLALRSQSANKSYDSAINVEEVTRKLEQLVQTSLSRFASENKAVGSAAEDQPTLLLLSIILSGAECATFRGDGRIRLTEEAISQLEEISSSYVSKAVGVGWKLQAFLLGNYPDRYDVPALFKQLEQASGTVDEGLVYNLVDAFVRTRDRTARRQLFTELVESSKLTAGPIGPLLAVRRLVELHQGPSTSSSDSENQDTIDLGIVHERLSSLLSRVESLRHFKQLSETLLLLLDKHASSMAQFNIEVTLSSVVQVCSQAGPRIYTPKAAGEIYDKLYKLVALVLRRHRLRLGGRFPILLGALRALLTTLLSNPGSNTGKAASSQASPPWLGSRLQSRHAERFARLLTLICEPSAASVAHARLSELDSATDMAKRIAGQDMFVILELYIKLQLEVTVPRDIRKALEPGVYSVLNITPQGCRRVLNESLDANGRAIFREMFADYKKFGKWTGV